MVTSATAISKSEIENVLAKIKTLSNKTHPLQNQPETEAASQNGFDNIISQVKNGLNAVSGAQQEDAALKTAYMQGDPDVPLSKVMVSSARSKVAFEGLVTVRKHFIEAYKEIMNMPI